MENTTQEQQQAALMAAASQALTVTVNLPGRLTSEYRALLIAQWIVVGLNALVWGVFAFSAHLPAWAPTVVSSISGMVIGTIQTNYANNRTQLKQATIDTAPFTASAN